MWKSYFIIYWISFFPKFKHAIDFFLLHKIMHFVNINDTGMCNMLVCRTVVSQVITGYLPSLILSMFLSFVPPIMIIFSSMQGYISHSRIEKSACIKVLWFTIWNIFFANVLSGTALYQVSVFLEPQKIPSVLAEAVPAQVSRYFHQ